MSQGGLANSSGNTLEQTVIATFSSKGFQVAPYRNWLVNPASFGGDVLLRRVPYTSIYGHNGVTEFLAISSRYELNARIECKWQQSAGSVDEKFPYLYLNCLERMPEQHIIIIVDGGGAKLSAVTWLKTVAAEGRYASATSVQKKIQVFSLSEFIVWANRTLR